MTVRATGKRTFTEMANGTEDQPPAKKLNNGDAGAEQNPVHAFASKSPQPVLQTPQESTLKVATSFLSGVGDPSQPKPLNPAPSLSVWRLPVSYPIPVPAQSGLKSSQSLPSSSVDNDSAHGYATRTILSNGRVTLPANGQMPPQNSYLKPSTRVNVRTELIGPPAIDAALPSQQPRDLASMLDGYDPKLSLLLPLQPPLQNFHSINGPPKGDLSKVIEAHITLAGYNIENGMGGECDVQLACIVDLIEQCQAEKSISSVVSLCIKRIALSPSKGILAPFFLRRLVSFDFLSAETKAIIFLEWGRFIKERAQHLKSLDLLCETIKIYEDLGIASLKLEKWQNAFDAFEKAHHNIPAQHPFLYELNYYKSLALKGLGRFKEAYEILARLVQEKHPHL